MASTIPLERLPNGKAKPGTKWRTFIRMRGYKPVSETHDTYDEGRKWGLVTESEMVNGTPVDFQSLKENTVADVFRWYIRDVAPLRRPASCKWETNVLRRLLKEPWVQFTLNKMPLIETGLREYIKRRLTGDAKNAPVKGQSLNRELNLISTAFNKVRKAAGFVTGNPVLGIERPETKNVKAYKVWSPQALQLWLDSFKFDIERSPSGATEFIPWTLLLVNTTGLRPVSLFATKLEWIDLEAHVIHYPPGAVKNDEQYECPLDPDLALPVVAKLVEHAKAARRSKLCPAEYASVEQLYRTHRVRLTKLHPELAGLCIYGQRHTWTTTNVPFFENLAEMMKYTGRKSVKTLLPYFQPTAKTQAQKLSERRKLAAAGQWQTPDRTEYANAAPKS